MAYYKVKYINKDNICCIDYYKGAQLRNFAGKIIKRKQITEKEYKQRLLNRENSVEIIFYNPKF